MSRFINRDPLGYVDGMSLYNGYFAENFDSDPTGLWKWKDGERGGGARATAVSEEGDSLKTLSDFIKLDLDERSKWIKNYDNEKVCTTVKCGQKLNSIKVSEEIICGKEISLPNTIYAYLGNWSGFSMAWTLLRRRAEFVTDMREKGYKVINGAASEATLEHDLSSEDVWGIGYFGHGAGGKLSEAGDGEIKWMTMLKIRGELNHHLGLAVIYACEGGLKPVFNASNLISSKGTFRSKCNSFKPLFFGSYKNLNYNQDGIEPFDDGYSGYEAGWQ